MSSALPHERSVTEASRDDEPTYDHALLELRTPADPVPDPTLASWASELGVRPAVLRILNARGFSALEDVRSFLAPSLKHHLPNPCQILNVERAADRILDAIDKGELITVYSDFDVDGLSAGSQLVLYLSSCGASVRGYTPSRFTEGYGFVRSAVEKLAKNGPHLVVTVDCGISNHQEIALAKSLGLSVIVLDHHQPHGLPPADVVVNPAQDGCPFGPHKLAAAGLVWMLLIVLRQRIRQRFGEERARCLPDPKDFLDLAALGTICDMVPLIGLNRVIAHRGIDAINSSSRPGLVALRNVCAGGSRRTLSAGHVSFQIGPRINAAGRIGDAMDVFSLLTTSDSILARSLAESVDRMNEQRRSVEEQVRRACLQQLEKTPGLATRPAIALYGDGYHLGVIGIVAQRLVEAFCRPAAVMAPGEMTVRGERRPVIKGSVRSVRGFHVAEVLQALTSLLVAHGGHAEAGGFSVSPDRLVDFQEAFVEEAARRLDSALLRRRIVGDAEVPLRDVDFDLVRDIQRLAPFGVGNPTPVLVSRRVTIASVTSIGNGHLRLRVSDGNTYVGAVGWSLQAHPLLRKGQRVDLAYQPELNTYQGVSSVQLNIREAWPV